MTASKSTKGRVAVQNNSGRLRLTLPREWFGGTQKRFALELDYTPHNWILAESIAKQVELDYLNGCFDSSLQKYKLKPEPVKQVEIIRPLKLGELWDRYQNYKAPSRKETTHNFIRILTTHIDRIRNLDCLDALTIRERLQSHTTNHQVKRILIELNAAVKWGIKHKLILASVSPFKGMAAELPEYSYQTDPKPNAFTEEDMARVIDAFQNHRGTWNGRGFAGSSYDFYTGFVQFLFLTGCRPAEAVGLRWENLSKDCTAIEFNGSLLYLNDRWIQTKGSKNNKSRVFPCSPNLQSLLMERRGNNDPKELVFPSKTGKIVNYNNFCNVGWKKVVNPIKPATTPYSCRDTFITLQLIKNVPAAVVAYWTDTSLEMIQRHYADVLMLRSIRPLD